MGRVSVVANGTGTRRGTRILTRPGHPASCVADSLVRWRRDYSYLKRCSVRHLTQTGSQNPIAYVNC